MVAIVMLIKKYIKSPVRTHMTSVVSIAAHLIFSVAPLSSYHYTGHIRHSSVTSQTDNPTN